MESSAEQQRAVDYAEAAIQLAEHLESAPDSLMTSDELDHLLRLEYESDARKERNKRRFAFQDVKDLDIFRQTKVEQQAIGDFNKILADIFGMTDLGNQTFEGTRENCKRAFDCIPNPTRRQVAYYENLQSELSMTWAKCYKERDDQFLVDYKDTYDQIEHRTWVSHIRKQNEGKRLSWKKYNEQRDAMRETIRKATVLRTKQARDFADDIEAYVEPYLLHKAQYKDSANLLTFSEFIERCKGRKLQKLEVLVQDMDLEALSQPAVDPSANVVMELEHVQPPSPAPIESPVRPSSPDRVYDSAVYERPVVGTSRLSEHWVFSKPTVFSEKYYLTDEPDPIEEEKEPSRKAVLNEPEFMAAYRDRFIEFDRLLKIQADKEKADEKKEKAAKAKARREANKAKPKVKVTPVVSSVFSPPVIPSYQPVPEEIPPDSGLSFEQSMAIVDQVIAENTAKHPPVVAKPKPVFVVTPVSDIRPRPPPLQIPKQVKAASEPMVVEEISVPERTGAAGLVSVSIPSSAHFIPPSAAVDIIPAVPLPIPKPAKFRIQGKELFVTYPRCPMTREQVLDLLTTSLSRYVVVEYIIAQEQHAEPDPEGTIDPEEIDFDDSVSKIVGTHIHAYVRLSKAVNFNHANFLDKDGYHPNIQRVKRRAAVVQYCTKEDKEPLSNFDYKAYIKAQIGKSKLKRKDYKQENALALDLTREPIEMVKEGVIPYTKVGPIRDFRAQLERYDALNRTRVTEFDFSVCPPWLPIELHYKQRVTFPISRETGQSIFWLCGGKQTGKTYAAVHQMDLLGNPIPHYSLHVAMDFSQYRNEQILVLNEFNGWMTPSSIIRLTEGEYMPAKYSVPIKVPSDVLVVITSNAMPDTMFKKYADENQAHWDAFMSRVNLVVLSGRNPNCPNTCTTTHVGPARYWLEKRLTKSELDFLDPKLKDLYLAFDKEREAYPEYFRRP